MKKTVLVCNISVVCGCKRCNKGIIAPSELKPQDFDNTWMLAIFEFLPPVAPFREMLITFENNVFLPNSDQRVTCISKTQWGLEQCNLCYNANKFWDPP